METGRSRQASYTHECLFVMCKSGSSCTSHFRFTQWRRNIIASVGYTLNTSIRRPQPSTRAISNMRRSWSHWIVATSNCLVFLFQVTSLLSWTPCFSILHPRNTLNKTDTRWASQSRTVYMVWCSKRAKMNAKVNPINWAISDYGNPLVKQPR